MTNFQKMKMAERTLRKISQIDKYIKVSKSFSLIKGPRNQKLADEDVALVMVGRDEANMLEEFYEYHRNLGVTHMLYVDNGSTDNSLDVAKGIDDLVVVQTSADFSTQQPLIRRIATQKYFLGGWRLLLDADEIFDYPGSDRFKLTALVRYLMEQGQTGVVAQMLDMVPEGRLSQARANTLSEARRKHIGFHLGGITSYPYHSPDNKYSWFLKQNALANQKIQIRFGGIRNLMFGENCMLTKHPLIRASKGVMPMPHPHISTGLNCASFTGLIRHYKFCGDPFARDKAHLERGHRSEVVNQEIRLRLSAYDESHDLDFGISGLRMSPTIGDLINDDFIVLDDPTRKALYA